MSYGKGVFISLEGGEGVGKTTQIELIKAFLKKKNIEFISTREPGGISISENIRNVILDKNNTAMDSKTEALLYAASRRQHLVERVIPALKQNKVIICDRFVDSSLAYQGYARNLGIDEIMAINSFAIENCMPHLTLLLDIEPEEGLKRIYKDKEREINRLDLENLEFHKRVREGYKILLQRFPQRIKKIDASGDIDEVFKYIEKEIEGVLHINGC